MAHLYRLKAFIFAFFLLTSQAQAAIPQVTAYRATQCPSSNYGGWHSTADAARESSLAQMYICSPSAPPGFYALTGISGNSFTICSSGCTFFVFYGTLDTSLQCPANSTLSGTMCTCDAGYVESGSGCELPSPINNCLDYVGGKTDISGRGGLGAKLVCISSGAPFNSGDPDSSGCVLSANADFAAVVDPKIGYEWVAQGTFTGSKCNPSTFEEQGTAPEGATDPSAEKGTAPTKCSPGQYPGSVNGVEVCVDPVGNDSTQKQIQKGDTTTNSDGSTTQTQQSQQTTCEGSQCTTTTTTTVTTTPAGGGASTTETTTSVGTCTRGSPGCGDEERDRSSFGGSCSAFACDGDAIMCAVALEQHRRNCQLYGESPESQLYDTEKGKTGPQYTSETVNLGPSSFSQVNALGAGAQCISDKTITVAGNTITLPFSQICSTLQHLGTVLLFIAFLTAYRIVSGR